MNTDYFLISFCFSKGTAIHLRLIRASGFEEACNFIKQAYGEENVNHFENLTIIPQESNGTDIQQKI